MRSSSCSRSLGNSMSALSISSISSTGRSSMRERLPQLALADVVADVADARVAELAVAQAAHRVVFVEALQRLGGRLDVPLDQRHAERLGDLERQHGLAGAGLALDEQGPLQCDGGIDGDLEVVGRHVVLRALELHELRACLPGPEKDARAYGKRWPSSHSSRARLRPKKGRHSQAALEVAKCDAGGRTQGRASLTGTEQSSVRETRAYHGGGAVCSFDPT